MGLSSNFLSVTDFIVGVCAVYALLGFGYMSDSTVSRYGRRKPYVLALTPILVFSLAMLYNPSSFPAEQTHVWFAAYYFLTQVVPRPLASPCPLTYLGNLVCIILTCLEKVTS